MIIVVTCNQSDWSPCIPWPCGPWRPPAVAWWPGPPSPPGQGTRRWWTRPQAVSVTLKLVLVGPDFVLVDHVLHHTKGCDHAWPQLHRTVADLAARDEPWGKLSWKSTEDGRIFKWLKLNHAFKTKFYRQKVILWQGFHLFILKAKCLASQYFIRFSFKVI